MKHLLLDLRTTVKYSRPGRNVTVMHSRLLSDGHSDGRADGRTDHNDGHTDDRTYVQSSNHFDGLAYCTSGCACHFIFNGASDAE